MEIQINKIIYIYIYDGYNKVSLGKELKQNLYPLADFRFHQENLRVPLAELESHRQNLSPAGKT